MESDEPSCVPPTVIFLRIRLGVGDDLLHRFIFRVGVHHQHVFVKGEVGDGGEVLESDRGDTHERRGQKARHRGDQVVGVLFLSGHIGEGDARRFRPACSPRRSAGEGVYPFRMAAAMVRAKMSLPPPAPAWMIMVIGFFREFAGAQGVSRPECETDNDRKQY